MKEIEKIKRGNAIMYHEPEMSSGSTHGGVMFLDWDGETFITHGRCGNSTQPEEEISAVEVIDIIENKDWDFC